MNLVKVEFIFKNSTRGAPPNVFEAQLVGAFEEHGSECIIAEDMKAPVFDVQESLYFPFFLVLKM